jgi:hypothetical protein
MEKLNLFFAKIRELTFWQRVFYWKPLRNLSYDAFEEFKVIEKNLSKAKGDFDSVEKEKTLLKAQNAFLEKGKLESDRKIDELNGVINSLNKSLNKYETAEEQRGKTYDGRIIQLNQIKESLESERNRLNDERVKEKEEEFEKFKKQWATHEASVQQTIKMICQNHFIKYIDKVPFKGNPDNTVEICGEYIIFDAKCPANDDLLNFPKYVKAQTEIVKKYAGIEDVKKDIFLVIPHNTIEVVVQRVYNMGDYNVYVITKESIEPIILTLKRIEDYEFAEQLSPEERDNICRVIGKFAHTTKRKIQIDQFFANQFLEILVKCKNDLPNEILEQVLEYEKAERLNPPMEKKSKHILTKELQDTNNTINIEANIRNITIPLSFEEVKNLE